MNHEPVVIIGAGPAGLTAAYELVKRDIRPVIIEKSDKVGGLARTETYKGYRFDIGGHRFFTHLKEAERLWQEVLGEEFIKVARLSRIYYQGRYFNYPLDIFNTLSNLGIAESVLISLSYLSAKLFPHPEEKTFEHWVINRFGRRLYQKFFKAYTEKLWGIPCHDIQGDWAAQRIQGLSLKTVFLNMMFGNNQTKSLISSFHYPLHGPGDMWERFLESVENQGGQVHLNSEAVCFHRGERHVKTTTLQNGEKTIEVSGNHFISSIPLKELLALLDPPPPANVLQAADKLAYRDFVLIGLIVDRSYLFPDQWIYIHSPEMRVGRIQNLKNWSSSMVPDLNKTSLGMEYFCTEGDDIWKKTDDELIDLAAWELVHLGLARIKEVEGGKVFRQRKAYPIYNSDYRKHLQVIRNFLSTIKNLQTIGRNGLHRYNNQDHSMLTGMLAVENVFGANHDLWELKEQQKYFE